MNRAMTLIEMLAAITLLGLVVLAMTGWMQTASRTAAAIAPSLRWEWAAVAVLEQVHLDLATGDLEQNPNNQRVQIVRDELVIRTRDSGPARHRYEFDEQSGRLRLVRESDEKDPAQPVSRILIEQVRAWIVALDHEDEQLRITIQGMDGQQFSRRYMLP